MMVRIGRIGLVLVLLVVSGIGARAFWEKLTGAPRQVQLTQEKIDAFITVQREMLRLSLQVSNEGSYLEQAKQGLSFARQLRAIEKQHGFDDPREAVLASVQNVQNGIDPETKVHGGPGRLEAAIAALKADKRIAPETKESLLKFYQDELETMKAAGPPPPGNIELVVKNYDKISKGYVGGGP